MAIDPENGFFDDSAAKMLDNAADCWHSGTEHFQLHCRPCDRDQYPNMTFDQWATENIANSVYWKTLAIDPGSPFVSFATYLTEAFYKSGEKRKLRSLGMSKHVGKSSNTYCIQFACSNCCRATDPLYPLHHNHAVLTSSNEILKKIVEHLIPSSLATSVVPVMDMIPLLPPPPPKSGYRCYREDTRIQQPPPPPPQKSGYRCYWEDYRKQLPADDTSTDADSTTADCQPPPPPLPKFRYRCYWEDTRKQQPVDDTSTEDDSTTAECDWYWTGERQWQGQWHWDWHWK